MQKALISTIVFLILSSALIYAEDDYLSQIEFTAGISPQLHADGFGAPMEGGLIFPVNLFDDLRLYGASAVGIQLIDTEIHGELSLLLSLKGWGEFWSTELERENIITNICSGLNIDDFGPYRVGASASLGCGAGLMNYWLKASGAHEALFFTYIRPGVGLFFDSDTFMLKLDLGYQIDFTDSSVRTFIIIPVSVTIHGPVFQGEAE